MELINKCIDYLKANPTLAYVIIGALAAIVIVFIVIIARSAKRSKAKKAAAQKTTAPVQKLEEASAPTPAPAINEDKDAARKATLERLEAERLAAEKEEAEEAAKAQKLAEEKAAADKRAADEKAAIEKAIAEKDAKENAAREKKAATAKAKAEAAKAKPATPKKKKAPAEEEDEIEKAARYSGKWTVCRVITDEESGGEETYFFELHANNGEKLLSSEEYTSYNGALRGIETHKANIEKGNFKITLSKKGDFIFKLLSGKNMLLCMGENYPTRARCESAIESTKRFAKTAVLDENLEDHLVKVPVEDDAEIEPVADGYNGKWVITSHAGADGEQVFYFELFANNGEKLLSSEEYTTYIGAVNGITTHKTNIEKGNFRISLTKRGDYIYKLLNGNGQLLCLGEHYKTKRRCQNAVESVKRFALNSPVLTDPALKK